MLVAGSVVTRYQRGHSGTLRHLLDVFRSFGLLLVSAAAVLLQVLQGSHLSSLTQVELEGCLALIVSQYKVTFSLAVRRRLRPPASLRLRRGLGRDHVDLGVGLGERHLRSS